MIALAAGRLRVGWQLPLRCEPFASCSKAPPRAESVTALRQPSSSATQPTGPIARGSYGVTHAACDTYVRLIQSTPNQPEVRNGPCAYSGMNVARQTMAERTSTPCTSRHTTCICLGRALHDKNEVTHGNTRKSGTIPQLAYVL